MIPGWEKHTYELTPIEMERLLPIVIESWRKKPVGEIVKMREMISGMNKYIEEKGMKDKKGKLLKVTGPRMRKMIHTIRVTGTVYNLIATSRGYFKSDNIDEVISFIDSCTKRANSFSKVAMAMNKNIGR